MKLRFQKQGNQAWTVTDMVVVIAVMVFLAALLLPIISAAKRRAQRINCVSNLNQIGMASHVWRIGLSFRVWEREGSNQVSKSVSSTNGSTVDWRVITNAVVAEWPVTTNAVECFQAMSNEFSSPNILICPADRERFSASNFQSDFNNSHISYFINPDASSVYPQQIAIGDDNLAINDIPVKSGLVTLPPNVAVSFTAARHHYVGNIGYADGSVAEVSNAGLQASLILATNGTPAKIIRLAIP